MMPTRERSRVFCCLPGRERNDKSRNEPDRAPLWAHCGARRGGRWGAALLNASRGPMSDIASNIQGGGIGRLAELIHGNPMDRLDTDMRLVIDTLTELGAKPLEFSSPEA